jgi:hypothetical protein
VREDGIDEQNGIELSMGSNDIPRGESKGHVVLINPSAEFPIPFSDVVKISRSELQQGVHLFRYKR